MKLKNFFTVMSVTLCTVACGDDKTENVVNPAQEVAGTYNGVLSLSVSGNDQGTSDSQVKISAEEGGTVQILLVGGAGEGTMSLPDITVPGIKVQTSDNVTYTFPESSIDVTVGSTKYTGSLHGAVKDEKADLVFILKPGAMPMAINAVFAGVK
ncbi:MAG: calycin-like domain-containing protein [Phocaeicola sp.]|nr:calycin-like domain-containing protein [Phocaeicola sp.]